MLSPSRGNVQLIIFPSSNHKIKCNSSGTLPAEPGPGPAGLQHFKLRLSFYGNRKIQAYQFMFFSSPFHSFETKNNWSKRFFFAHINYARLISARRLTEPSAVGSRGSGGGPSCFLRFPQAEGNLWKSLRCICVCLCYERLGTD